ncbi:nitrous oxide reductase family maturation protein NosD [Denitratisoma oestradiolicum]|uniref:Copper ABC transporter substrate-binding protein n=1 Tax=Denitratisoma oestradiolicum TaxID=311182 RepID=A0A6S6XY21_9PROT|nr:nitrous oxide reductase family maturation protein NosD [Denitratisoma oestradiolicum]TWO80790.1 copper ABC transporter substrate-binding protein [Denitratisoma oestradiolicum]CAB1370894.1 Copper ABC transporter substrate-binding protein [Denitratisoma oestradiolicum]
MRSSSLVFLLAWALLQATPASATTWRVSPGLSIAAAVAKAAAGDTVEVAAGRYEERLRIDKPLTLTGIGRPTLAGGLEGDTLRITAPDVTVQGFIIADSGGSLEQQNAGIYVYPGSHRARILDCVFSYTLFGLWIEKSDDVEVRGNLITGKRDFSSSQRGNGIQLYNTRGARIENNHISYVRDAIYVDVSHHAQFRGNRMHHSRYGTHYMNSYYNVWEDNESFHNRGGLALMEVRNQVVRNNRAWGNSDHGIMLRTIQDSVVENNIVAGNGRGLFIYDAEYITLTGNLIVDNRVGVHLAAGSTRNQVEGNDLIQNQEQVRYVASRDEPWGTKSGNYWSNYLGWDRDGDGIGDVPYEASDLVDRLTWRHPLARLLMASPALQTLRLIARQFPLLRAPSVVDTHPRMKPARNDWRQWLGKQYR